MAKKKNAPEVITVVPEFTVEGQKVTVAVRSFDTAWHTMQHMSRWDGCPVRVRLKGWVRKTDEEIARDRTT